MRASALVLGRDQLGSGGACFAVGGHHSHSRLSFASHIVREGFGGGHGPASQPSSATSTGSVLREGRKVVLAFSMVVLRERATQRYLVTTAERNIIS